MNPQLFFLPNFIFILFSLPACPLPVEMNLVRLILAHAMLFVSSPVVPELLMSAESL